MPILPLLMLILVVAVVVYSLAIEPLLCTVERVNIPVRLLNTPVTILFLTDMHHYKWGSREDVFCKKLPSTNVDLILFGGDFIGDVTGIPTATAFINVVSKRYVDAPMFAVLGNAEHKLRISDQNRFKGILQDHGVHVLCNDASSVNVSSQRLTIVGTDDPYYGFHDLEKAFQGVSHESPVILLTHSPQITRTAVRYAPDVIISGHTHGGQVRLPVIGPLRTQNPLTRLLSMGLFSPEELTKLFASNSRLQLWLYISRGLGLACIPKFRIMSPRLFCRPEITLITLVGDSA